MKNQGIIEQGIGEEQINSFERLTSFIKIDKKRAELYDNMPIINAQNLPVTKVEVVKQAAFLVAFLALFSFLRPK